MSPQLNERLAWLAANPKSLKGMLRGLEKESLRIDDEGNVAQTSHPAALGSALTHSMITTDYSEALLELITPACGSVSEALSQLDDLHRYVYSHIGSERLWVNSMPCRLGSDEQIPLAQYGTSNIGRMKTLYRHGLGMRYGRKMQMIAGIHYNVSFPDSLWALWMEQEKAAQSIAAFRSEKYFGLIRNFQRYSWLLLYLLGASPAVCGSFLEGRAHGLERMPSGTLYKPNATSLRMSSLGYQNDAQADLQVSYNALDEYVRDLDRAMRTPYAPYTAMGVVKNGQHLQINDHILQIENEYYGLIRPKRNAKSRERPTQALARGGVEYIELRCVDLDPFEPLGIGRDTAHFLEVFALFCLLQDSPAFAADDYARLPVNQQAMVERGRDAALTLATKAGEAPFRVLAAKVMSSLREVALLLDAANDTSAYSNAIEVQLGKLQEPALTGSAAVLQGIDDHDGCFFAFAMSRAEAVLSHFKQRRLSDKREQELRDLASDSLYRQQMFEAQPQQPFQVFLDAYFDEVPQVNL